MCTLLIVAGGAGLVGDVRGRELGVACGAALPFHHCLEAHVRWGGVGGGLGGVTFGALLR